MTPILISLAGLTITLIGIIAALGVAWGSLTTRLRAIEERQEREEHELEELVRAVRGDIAALRDDIAAMRTDVAVMQALRTGGRSPDASD